MHTSYITHEQVESSEACHTHTRRIHMCDMAHTLVKVRINFDEYMNIFIYSICIHICAMTHIWMSHASRTNDIWCIHIFIHSKCASTSMNIWMNEYMNTSYVIRMWGVTHPYVSHGTYTNAYRINEYMNIWTNLISHMNVSSLVSTWIRLMSIFIVFGYSIVYAYIVHLYSCIHICVTHSCVI